MSPTKIFVPASSDFIDITRFKIINNLIEMIYILADINPHNIWCEVLLVYYSMNNIYCYFIDTITGPENNLPI